MTHPQDKGNDLIAQISKAVELKACIRKAMKAVPKDYGAAMDAHAALQELPTMENLLERALTALKAESSPHVVAEQVEHKPAMYQVRKIRSKDGKWQESTSVGYDLCLNSKEWEGRKLYTAPQQTTPLTEAKSLVPEGWRVVPKEPTPDMMEAAHKVNDKSYVHNYGKAASPDELYCAMVDAAPTPPLNTQDGVDEKGWLVEFEGDHGEILYAASGGGWFTKDANNAARFHNAIFANCFFCGYWMRLAYEVEGHHFRDKWLKRMKLTEHIFIGTTAAPSPPAAAVSSVDERAEFEKWWRSEGSKGRLAQTTYGTYLEPITQHKWSAWQARAALAVKATPTPFFLIEKLWVDSMENRDAMGYLPYCIATTQDEAQAFVDAGGFTQGTGWPIEVGKRMPNFRAQFLPSRAALTAKVKP